MRNRISQKLPPTTKIELPESAQPGWFLFNAPRPLVGTVTWTSDFLHGIFYAAVDPDDDQVDWMVKQNYADDATLLLPMSDQEWEEMMETLENDKAEQYGERWESLKASNSSVAKHVLLADFASNHAHGTWTDKISVAQKQ